MSKKISISLFAIVSLSLCLEPAFGKTIQISKSLKSAIHFDPQATSDVAPPMAPRIMTESTIHNDVRQDEFAWMLNKTDQRMIDYLNAENVFTEKVTLPLKPLQEKILSELKSTIPAVQQSAPEFFGKHEYFSRQTFEQKYAVLLRKSIDGGAEEVILDQNKLAKEKSFFNLGSWLASADGKFLMYATDEVGFRDYKLFLKNLETGETTSLANDLSNTWGYDYGAFFAPDLKSAYIVTDDASKRPSSLWKIDLASGERTQIYTEDDRTFNLYIQPTSDGRYLNIVSSAIDTTEHRILDWKRENSQGQSHFEYFIPRAKGHNFEINFADGKWLIKSNWNRKEFAILEASSENLIYPDQWKILVPESTTRPISGLAVTKRGFLVEYISEGIQEYELRSYDNPNIRKLEFPEKIYQAGIVWSGLRYAEGKAQISYTSLLSPSVTYEVNFQDASLTKVQSTDMKLDVDLSEFTIKRTHTKSHDGVIVPVTLLQKKNAPQNGKGALYIYGYGSYGSSNPVSFRPEYLALARRGVTVALAHIRGGQEYGQQWYLDGKLQKKKNSFLDFIAVTEELIRQGYATSERIAIEGISAGGLLMGAVLNMRPDLYRVAHVGVPFVDAVNSMLNPDLPLVTQEYSEWGNPNIPEDYFYMKSYCPYTNISDKNYPAIYVSTSYHDSQVLVHEPAKYVAKMRLLSKSKYPLLLKTEMKGGHGGASYRFGAYRSKSEILAFLPSCFRK
jgi:oligopeptidase B